MKKYKLRIATAKNKREYIKKYNRKLKVLDLNEENVLKLYKMCAIPKDQIGKTPNIEKHTKIFNKEKSGKDSPEIVFDGREINKHTFTIQFLLGQLKVIHDQLKRFYTFYGPYEI